MVRAAVAILVCAACQGQPTGAGAGAASGRPPEPPGPGDATADTGASDATGSAGAVAAGREPDARGKSDEPEPPDPGRVISELAAIPAWQAVVDRAQLLGRRGQHGVVYGRVGPAVMVPAPPPSAAAAGAGSGTAAGSGAAVGAGSGTVAGSGAAAGAGSGTAAGSGAAVGAGSGTAGGAGAKTGSGAASAGARPAAAPGTAPGAAIEPALVASPYVWLIDDTEGNGALGIRIALGDKAREGDRIAAGGAWQLDADRRWFWKPDAIQPLPPAPASDLKEPPAAPSHVVAIGALPPGARTASVARDGDAVYFQLVGPAPAGDGDGWQVADQLGSPTALVMTLPGERASYGGQDMRAADERWQLRRGQTYWVRIGKLHKRGDKPANVNARTAPIRVP